MLQRSGEQEEDCGEERKKKRTEDITASLRARLNRSVSLKPALMVSMNFPTLHSVLILLIPYEKENAFFPPQQQTLGN